MNIKIKVKYILNWNVLLIDKFESNISKCFLFAKRTISKISLMVHISDLSFNFKEIII